jgi:hypothetical protein
LEDKSSKYDKKKADDFSTVKSYRPISITSYLAKLNERLNRLISSLTDIKTLVSFQSGDRQLHFNQ